MPKGRISKEFEPSDELRKLGEEVIDEQKLDIGNAKIQYLLVYPHINKTTAGRCVRTGMELKFFSDSDYLIEMSGELWDSLDSPTQKILMEHELRHIMPIINDKTGDCKYQIRPHDVEDFSSIIKKHGTDWIQKVKLSISSIYDLNPTEEDKITI